jgi:hypothetical protein
MGSLKMKTYRFSRAGMAAPVTIAASAKTIRRLKCEINRLETIFFEDRGISMEICLKKVE